MQLAYKFTEAILAITFGFIWGLLAVGVVLCLSSCSAEAFNDSVFRLRPADAPNSGGTGFLVEHNGENYLLTNRHVCEITETKAFIADNKGNQYAALVEYISPTDDLCLLKASKRITAKPLKVAGYDVAPGSLVHSEGFPGLRNQVRSIGILQSYEAQISGYVPGTFTVMGKVNMRAIPGMSGSPVFDSYGQVVGVIARLSLLDAHSMLFVPGDRVRNFLASSNVVASVKQNVRLEALQASLQYGIQYELLLAIIEVESNFNPLAIGKDGELGVMQLHPKWHSPKLGDIEGNIEKGTRFLHYIKQRFEPVYGDAWFVAYNFGPSRMLSDPRATEYYKRVTKVLGRER